MSDVYYCNSCGNTRSTIDCPIYLKPNDTKPSVAGECVCDARFSGVDENEYRARGCPSCVCPKPQPSAEAGEALEFWLYGDHDDEYDTGYSVFTEKQPKITYDVELHVIEYAAVERLREELAQTQRLLVERNQNALLAVENYNRINGLRNEANAKAELLEKDLAAAYAALESIRIIARTIPGKGTAQASEILDLIRQAREQKRGRE